jgi:DnaJ-class molecular chaperone
MPPNFYQILGVGQGGQGVDEAGLKVAFRAFAKRNHPDRPEVGRGGEELFIEVRDAFEALKDPVVRFAYDRWVGGYLFILDAN